MSSRGTSRTHHSASHQEVDQPCYPSGHIFSPAALLALLDKLRDEASDHACDALDAVDHSIIAHPHDARALRRRRHEIAGLFSVFLSNAALPGNVYIPRRIGAPFIQDLRQVLQKAAVTSHTTDAILRAIKVVCNSQQTAASLRTLYIEAACKAAAKGTLTIAELSTDTAVMSVSAGMRFDKFPVNHYTTMFRRMRCAAGPDVRDAYRNLAKELARADLSAFTVTRRLCRSIQRTVFHFLRSYASAPDSAFQQKAIRTLGSSILRKLLRAGYDPYLVDPTMDLILFMAMDEEVLRMAQRLAKSETVQVAVESEEAIPIAEAEAGGDGDSGELEAMAEALQEHILAASQAGSGGFGADGSLGSVDSLNEGSYAHPGMKIMDQISPVHSSEDAGLDGGFLEDEDGSQTQSDDTARSEWARVERLKAEDSLRAMEEALRKARQLDRAREMQSDREREIDEEAAVQRMRDDEFARRSLRGSRDSQVRSQGSFRTGSFRGHVDSMHGRSTYGPRRDTLTRAVNKEDIYEEEGMRGSNRRASYSTLGERESISALRRSIGRDIEGSRSGY